MARTLDEILEEYNQIYFTYDNYRRDNQVIVDYIRERFPKSLRGEDNDKFFEFVDKLFSYSDKIDFYIYILQYQFSVLTAKGKFLDNLGRWLGLSRPPLPTKRTNEPVVIFGMNQKDSGMSDEEYKEQALLHNLTGWEADASSNTFFPLKDFVGDTLVNDAEYRVYILGVLKLKKGIDLPTILEVMARTLIRPFFITKHNADILELTCHYEEDQNRLVIAREIASKLRTTGFDIQVLQATSEKPPEISAVYGEDCWEQENPYIDYDEDSGGWS